MRVIYVANNWIADGSSSVYATYNVWGLAQNQVDTHLVVRNVSQGDTGELMRSYFNLEQPGNLTIHRIQKRFKKANIEYYWKAARLIRQLADEDTVVISRTPKIFPYLLQMRKRPFRIYYETHNFFHDLGRRDDLKKINFSLRKTAFQEKAALKKIDGLICLTHTLENLWKQYVDLPVHVVYPGLIRASHPERNFDTINLAYTGALDMGRGIDRILEMAAYLPSNFRVYLFGGKNHREIDKLRGLIDAGKLENQVEVTGWLPQGELQRRLEKMHLGLLPLKDNFFNRYLTAPSKFFDYLSSALPVLSSSLPALEELVSDQQLGMLVDWSRPDEVAGNVVRLMADRPGYDILSQRVHRFAKEHTWEKRGERLVQALYG